MDWLFGKRKTPAGSCGRAVLDAFQAHELEPCEHCVLGLCAEMLRENKRMLDKAIRELDRERMALQNQEKKTIVEIKKMAKEGQMVCGCSLPLPPPTATCALSSARTFRTQDAYPAATVALTVQARRL
jgi:hypothetical protein